jgi:hypothetical protein
MLVLAAIEKQASFPDTSDTADLGDTGPQVAAFSSLT